MRILLPFAAVIVLMTTAWICGGLASLQPLLGIYLPYAAFAVFVVGFILRVVQWARSPVPFRIPTTCGQQKSLPWIKRSGLESPYTTLEVIGRMALEVLLFRSLFRNTKTALREGGKLAYGSDKWLWVGGMAFHYTFLVIAIRHLRFFIEPIPGAVKLLESLDGLFQVGVPVLYLTDVIFLSAVTYLFVRRVLIPQVKYISLPADYFPLFLIFGIGSTGVLMRYFVKVDVVKVKELAVGLASFHPVVPEGIGAIFFAHLFLLCVLFVYFPFSKLMHMGGVFLSPTRNLANDNRARRHINPWNHPVKVHTYEEYEDEFRDKIKEVGLPVDKE